MEISIESPAVVNRSTHVTLASEPRPFPCAVGPTRPASIVPRCQFAASKHRVRIVSCLRSSGSSEQRDQAGKCDRSKRCSNLKILVRECHRVPLHSDSSVVTRDGVTVWCSRIISIGRGSATTCRCVRSTRSKRSSRLE